MPEPPCIRENDEHYSSLEKCKSKPHETPLHSHYENAANFIFKKKQQQRGGETGILIHCCLEGKMFPAVKRSLTVPQTAKHKITMCFPILLLHLYPPKLKTDM